MARKQPAKIKLLQTEVMALRARVRSLDQQIRQQSDAA
jgi:hypothetical protein